MSFGFSVGDFIAVIQLANKIRNDFASAPSQFAEVKNLSITLNRAWNIRLGRKLDKQEKADLEHITSGCRKVLTELEHVFNANSELKPQQKSFSIRKLWKQLNWRPHDIRDLRARINVNINLLKNFTESVIREDKYRRDVLDWLTPIDSASEQHAVFKRMQEGTGQWLLNSDKFRTWSMTFLLASKMIAILSLYISTATLKQDEQEAEGLLANLLKQLAEGKSLLPESVQSFYDKWKANKTRPSIDDISKALRLVVAKYARVFILVDALDECRALGGGREKLLTTTFDLQKYGANFFATSRNEPEITELLKRSPSLEIRADEQDLRRYVESRISDLPAFVRRDSDLQKEVKTEVVKAVTGVALSIIELQHALAVRVDTPELDESYIIEIEEIVPVCAGLVTVDEQSNMIGLVHYTTQKYLEVTLSRWHPNAEFDITETCLTYLSFTVFESGFCHTGSSFEERLLLNPLYDYTVHHWGQHAHQASRLHPKVLEFLQCKIKVEAAAQAMLAPKYAGNSNRCQRVPRRITGLHLAAYFGITVSVAAVLQITEVDVDSKDSWGQTPLSWAADNGHEAVVKLLLDTGKVDFDSKDSLGRTPLSWAAENGHEAVVKLLKSTASLHSSPPPHSPPNHPTSLI
ncbi:ankyrin [Mytilinidion resinicola]|uniref:Ankyrin n=1 Tax=Mytilinidion resinicola TaxID=574789 RepID=A0A6A6XZ12_9PEZI|nr:ankyrin [Mytilinidion resinicola]KAF2801528.1 ankyrin [Mytilinidion resinicola]